MGYIILVFIILITCVFISKIFKKLIIPAILVIFGFLFYLYPIWAGGIIAVVLLVCILGLIYLKIETNKLKSQAIELINTGQADAAVSLISQAKNEIKKQVAKTIFENKNQLGIEDDFFCSLIQSDIRHHLETSEASMDATQIEHYARGIWGDAFSNSFLLENINSVLASMDGFVEFKDNKTGENIKLYVKPGSSKEISLD